MRLERIQSEFESPVAYHFARVRNRHSGEAQTFVSGDPTSPTRTMPQ